MRIPLLFSLFLLVSSLVKAQDVHLTQYYTSNLSLNPAYTGNYDGDIRMVVNARGQWGQVATPIRTNMFSFEKKLHRFPDEIGIGLLVVNDQISTFHFNSNKALLTSSYQKNLNGHLVRLGIQGGIVSRSINFNGQTFPDQWNYPGGIFDPSIASGESSLQNSYTYPDLSGGAGWIYRLGKVKFTAGYALFHINHPRDGFTTNSRKLPFRHVLNTSANYHLSDKVNIIPHILYMSTASATDFIVGTNARKMLKKDIGIMVGAGYRGSNVNTDAAMAIGGFTYKRFDFGMSMDFNLSQLSKNARNKSAWEISIIYTTPSRIPGKVTLPCDRY